MASTSARLRLEAAATLALAGAPVYWLQGRRLRRRIPRLDEAPGERRGSVAGSEPVYRIAGLGESPMAAVGLADQSEALIPRLAAVLNSATGHGVEWSTAAQSGATAHFARKTLLPRLEHHRAGVVIVGLGVNDCLSLSSPRRWRDELQQLLDAIRHRLGPQRIILAGIPPMQHFPALPFPLSKMLGLRAALLDAVSARLAATAADVSHAPMNFVESSDGIFCRDGFHPNAQAHALWARQLAGMVTDL